jgi:microcystin-dependent protein
VLLWTTAVAPANFVLCDGAAYSTATYPALFALIGDTFNDTASVVPAPGFFAVPDLRDRFVVGASAGSGRFGSSNVIGDTTNTNPDGTVIVDSSQMPLHNHAITFTDVAHTHTVAPHAHTATAAPHTHNYANATANNVSAVGEPNAGYTAQFGTGVTDVQNSSSSSSSVVTVNNSATLVTSSAFTGLASSNFTSAFAGNSQPLNVLPPALALVYIIKVT